MRRPSIYLPAPLVERARAFLEDLDRCPRDVTTLSALAQEAVEEYIAIRNAVEYDTLKDRPALLAAERALHYARLARAELLRQAAALERGRSAQSRLTSPQRKDA